MAEASTRGGFSDEENGKRYFSQRPWNPFLIGKILSKKNRQYKGRPGVGSGTAPRSGGMISSSAVSSLAPGTGERDKRVRGLQQFVSPHLSIHRAHTPDDLTDYLSRLSDAVSPFCPGRSGWWQAFLLRASMASTKETIQS